MSLARAAADEVDRHPDLDLVAPPSTVTCVFRWRDAEASGPDDAVMTSAARRLFATGEAVVGRTRIDGAVALKPTFVNPVATADDARTLVRRVAAACRSGTLDGA
ncbi:MAG TPA: hypothetical protein VGO60_10320 [Iamia sp.]|nr:hypothetical protein [Iamia sp.]